MAGAFSVWHRVALHGDDADQDHGDFSAAGIGVGDARPLRETQTRVSLRARRGRTSALSYGLWLSLVAGEDCGATQDICTPSTLPKAGGALLAAGERLWSFHGGTLGGSHPDSAGRPAVAWVRGDGAAAERRAGSGRLDVDPVFGASVLSVAGYILFMTVQNHPQPRYFTVVGLFCFIVIARGAGAAGRWSRDTTAQPAGDGPAPS